MLILSIKMHGNEMPNGITKFLHRQADWMIDEDLLPLRLENSTESTRELIEQGLSLMSSGLDRVQHLGDEIVAMGDENVQVKLTELFHVKLIGSVPNTPTNGFRMDIGVLMFQPGKDEHLLLWLRNGSTVDSHGEIERKVLLTLSLIKMNCVAKVLK
jgi:hypothetical protein